MSVARARRMGDTGNASKAKHGKDTCAEKSLRRLYFAEGRHES